MGSIANSMMTLAKKTQYSVNEVVKLFQKGNDGDRIAALEHIHGQLDPVSLEIVVEAIRKPRTAFEQYRALLGAEQLLPLIDAKSKKLLAEVIVYQRSGKKGTMINSQDQTRYYLSGRILDTLGVIP